MASGGMIRRPEIMVGAILMYRSALSRALLDGEDLPRSGDEAGDLDDSAVSHLYRSLSFVRVCAKNLGLLGEASYS